MLQCHLQKGRKYSELQILIGKLGFPTSMIVCCPTSLPNKIGRAENVLSLNLEH